MFMRHTPNRNHFGMPDTVLYRDRVTIIRRDGYTYCNARAGDLNWNLNPEVQSPYDIVQWKYATIGDRPAIRHPDTIPRHANPFVTGVLPTDSDVRKGIPLATGCLEYFPDALCAVAQLSKVGNDKHNPGQPLHWARGKSDDHADTMLRHQVEHGKRDTDHVRHSAKVAWRALAQLQVEIEKSRQQVVYTSSDEVAMKLGFI